MKIALPGGKFSMIGGPYSLERNRGSICPGHGTQFIHFHMVLILQERIRNPYFRLRPEILPPSGVCAERLFHSGIKPCGGCLDRIGLIPSIIIRRRNRPTSPHTVFFFPPGCMNLIRKFTPPFLIIRQGTDAFFNISLLISQLG